MAANLALFFYICKFLARYLCFLVCKPVYLRQKSVKPVKMEGKIMKAKRWLVLAVGAMLVMNVSARGVKRMDNRCKCKPIRMEQRFVRCERCGKMIDVRKDARFKDFRRGEFRRGDFRGGEFRGGEFRGPEFKKHHRHHGRR